MSSYPIPGLDALVARNRQTAPSAPLQLTGRYLPLVYALISTLIAPPHNKTIIVIDLENRFDATRLTSGDSGPDRDPPQGDESVNIADAANEVDPDDPLRHVHVYRPARCNADRLREFVAGAEAWMLYGRHDSRNREWWGTILIGAPLSAAAAPAPGRLSRNIQLTASWRGWMRVDREDVRGFALGACAGEALGDREKRQDAVDAAPWTASCAWGTLAFKESDGTGTGTDAQPTKDEPAPG
ncbi:hypothetical protein ACHAQA_001006 [Verticillium albo-atrum]